MDAVLGESSNSSSTSRTVADVKASRVVRGARRHGRGPCERREEAPPLCLKEEQKWRPRTSTIPRLPVLGPNNPHPAYGGPGPGRLSFAWHQGDQKYDG